MWKNVRKTNKSIFHILGGKLSKIGYSIPKTEPWNRITKTHILTYDSCMDTKSFTIIILGSLEHTRIWGENFMFFFIDIQW